MNGDSVRAGQTGQIDVLGCVSGARNNNGVGQRNCVGAKRENLESFRIAGTICSIIEMADFVACECEQGGNQPVVGCTGSVVGVIDIAVVVVERSTVVVGIDDLPAVKHFFVIKAVAVWDRVVVAVKAGAGQRKVDIGGAT